MSHAECGAGANVSIAERSRGLGSAMCHSAMCYPGPVGVKQQSAVLPMLPMPKGKATRLPPEPRTVAADQEWPEWKCWSATGDAEMGGLMRNEGLTQIPRPQDETVIRTCFVFKWKAEANDES